MADATRSADLTEAQRGRKPGDRRVRVERPGSRYFRYGGPGTVVARPAASEPRGPGRAGSASALAGSLFGRLLANDEELEQRLPKWKALAVFSSDVMSSVAYATEASMFTLLAVGTGAFGYLMPISFLIVGAPRHHRRLLPPDDPGLPERRRQLHRRPREPRPVAGPGRRGRAPDRLRPDGRRSASRPASSASPRPSRSSWTTAVSIIAALAILVVMAVNLRGIRESGTIFALPTYIFVGAMLAPRRRSGIVRTVLGDAAPGDRRRRRSGARRDR